MSITDVAKKAGVSVATASRVLNGKPSVKPELARRVRAAAAELGYVPRTVRPGPKPRPDTPKQGTGVLGLVIRNQAQPLESETFTGRVFQGITSEALRHGCNPMVIVMPKAGIIPPVIREQRLDGLIFTGAPVIMDQTMADSFHPLPCVQLGGAPLSVPIIDHVLADNSATGAIAADYLLERGCRHPAYLAHASEYPAFPPRWEAFRSRLESRGMNPARVVTTIADARPRDVWNSDTVKQQIMVALDQLLRDHPYTDGIFLPTDQQAAACHALLKQRGIEPETDMTLISCDNAAAWLMSMDPRPATIDIFPDEQGRQCVRRLLERIKNPGMEPMVMMIRPKLITGDSSATES